MDNNILTKSEIHAARNFIDGREFVNAVANAPSKEALKQILNDGGIHNFDDAQLDYCYKNLALSQNWDAVSSLFQDKDFFTIAAIFQKTVPPDGFLLIFQQFLTQLHDFVPVFFFSFFQQILMSRKGQSQSYHS